MAIVEESKVEEMNEKDQEDKAAHSRPLLKSRVLKLAPVTAHCM